MAESSEKTVSPSVSIFPGSSCSTLQQEVDSEKGFTACPAGDVSLSTYVVPVLEKGVKTALQAPVSPWTRFRIWYNPYRMVSTFVASSSVVHLLSLLTIVALHAVLYSKYGRAASGMHSSLPVR